MDEITRRISFGVGVPNGEEVKDHPVYDRINRDAPLPGVRNLLGKARTQLGTVGSGNHYVDLFAEEGTDRIWIGVHFGSRGFGHQVASGFLALAQGQAFEDRAKEGEASSPPVLFHKDSPLGHLYLESMAIAGEYAYAGRDAVVDKVLDILGNPGVFHEVHNHHNFLWQEEINGRTMYVVRKGCTPLYQGQQGFVGGSMGENAVIIEGEITNQPSAWVGTSSLWSAPHGAGRVMVVEPAAGVLVRHQVGEQFERGVVVALGDQLDAVLHCVLVALVAAGLGRNVERIDAHIAALAALDDLSQDRNSHRSHQGGSAPSPMNLPTPSRKDSTRSTLDGRPSS